MNLELFNDAQATEGATKAADAAAIAAADATSDLPREVVVLEEVYRGEIALREDIDARLTELNGKLEGYYTLRHSKIRLTDGTLTGEDLERYVAHIQRIAENKLSDDGAPFTGTLSHTEYCKEGDSIRRRFHWASDDEAAQAKIKAQLYAHYSPIALWRELYKQFDPNAQRRAANYKAANVIRGAFGMLREASPEMKVVGGRIEVCVCVYTTVSFAGKHQLSHHSLAELGDALQQCMNDARLETAFGRNLRNLANSLHEYGRGEIVSRQRDQLGDGVDVVQGYKVFKLYLPQEIANTVNMFLAEYPDRRG